MTKVHAVHGVARADERRASLMLFTAVLLTSLNYSVMSIGLRQFDPLVFSVLRFAIGGFALLVVARLREGTLSLGLRDAAVVGVVGLLGIALQQGTLAFAIMDAGAADTAILAATVPLMTAVLAALTGLDSLRQRHWLAVVGGLIGVSLVVYAGASGGRPQSTALGNALALVNAFVAAAAAFPLAYLLRRHSAVWVLGYEMLIGTAIMLPFAAPELLRLDPTRIDQSGWISLAFTTVVSGAVAALLYFSGLREVGPARAALFQYLAPPLAVAFAVVFVGETLLPLQLLGGAIILASLAISPRPTPGRPQAAARSAVSRADSATSTPAGVDPR